MIPSLDFFLFVELHDIFDELDNSLLTEDRLILFVFQNFLRSVGQIELRE